MSQEEAPLLLRREGPVLHATLNRPARRNALSAALAAALDAMIEGLRGDRETRVLVIGGAGGHFCAGLDLTEAGSPQSPEEKHAAQLERNRRTAARLAAFAALPQVVIARIEGSAYAGGLGLVCAADLALADATARFAAPEVRRGLVPAQILPWLVRRMGHSDTARLVLQGGAWDAPAALRARLVHELLPDAAALDSRLATVIADLCQGAPGALAATKELLAALGPVAPDGYAEAGAHAFARAAASEAAEGIAAFREKRPPAWAVR